MRLLGTNTGASMTVNSGGMIDGCTYGFLTSQSLCDGYTPDGLKNGDLSPIGYHRQTALNLRFQVGENCRKFHAPEQNPTENYGT